MGIVAIFVNRTEVAMMMVFGIVMNAHTTSVLNALNEHSNQEFDLLHFRIQETLFSKWIFAIGLTYHLLLFNNLNKNH